MERDFDFLKFLGSFSYTPSTSLNNITSEASSKLAIIDAL